MAFGKNLMGNTVGFMMPSVMPPGFGAGVALPMPGDMVMTQFSAEVALPEVKPTNTGASEAFTEMQSTGDTDTVMNTGNKFMSAMDARLGETIARARRAQEKAARGAAPNVVAYRRV